MNKVRKWSELETTDERVERLRNVLLFVAMASIVSLVLVLVMFVSLIMDDNNDDKPASPKKVEQTVDHNNEA